MYHLRLYQKEEPESLFWEMFSLPFPLILLQEMRREHGFYRTIHVCFGEISGVSPHLVLRIYTFHTRQITQSRCSKMEEKKAMSHSNEPDAQRHRRPLRRGRIIAIIVGVFIL